MSLGDRRRKKKEEKLERKRLEKEKKRQQPSGGNGHLPEQELSVSQSKKIVENVEEIEQIVDDNIDKPMLYEAIDNNPSEQINTGNMRTPVEKSVEKAVVKSEQTYIDEMILFYKSKLDSAMGQLEQVQSNVNTARRNLVVLDAIKNSRVVLEVDWVLDTICEIDEDVSIDASNKLKTMKTCIFDFVYENVVPQLESKK